MNAGPISFLSSRLWDNALNDFTMMLRNNKKQKNSDDEQVYIAMLLIP